MPAKKKDDQEILAKIRTLLALERNYLAEERTALSKLRTGLALLLIGPSVSALLIYLIPLFPIKVNTLFDLLNIAFFSIITIAGLWALLSAQIELRKIRRKKNLLRTRETEIIQKNQAAKDLLGDFLNY